MNDKMRVLRTIHPVGHGGFFTEELCEGNDCFNVVYDCGTRNGVQSLEQNINQAFQKKTTIDLLFISHFDSDHVNGLGLLRKKSHLNEHTKVVIPFHYPEYFALLNPFLYTYYERCMNIIRSTGATIIEVEEMNPFEESETWLDSDGGGNHSFVSFGHLRGIIPSGSRIVLSPKWVYVPFNLNNSKVFFDTFEDEVRNQLGMDIGDMTPLELEQNVDILRGIYQLIGEKNDRSFNINSNSLIVLSYPTKEVNSCNTLIGLRKFSADAVSALYTGDAYLKDFTKGSFPFSYYTALKYTLRKYVNMPIGLFQISHHGSNSNYDTLLRNEIGLCQFAFCCQDDRDKMHGTTRNVCNDLSSIAKVMVYVVDENGNSEVRQEIFE